MRVDVRRLESILPRQADGFGGKARDLAELSRAGFPVPAAFAVHGDVSRAFFAAALDPEDQPAALLKAPATAVGPERLARLADRVRAAPLGPDVSEALREAFSHLRGDGAVALAVRSSSTWEDDAAVSAAGIHQTILGVETEAELFDAVRRTWASLLTPAALTYLRTARADAASPALGLVLQTLVPADVAGVLFTVNPLSGDEAEVVVNSALGLGSTVMDGKVSPDTFRVDKASRFVRDRVIGDKRLAARYRPGHGVVHEEPDPDAASRPSLDDESLEELVSLGLRVESHFEDARDIEWAIHQGHLYLLQARPVTAIAHRPRRIRRRDRRRDRSRTVWSKVNVGEALPGVATPLTWSVLSEFSERGFRRAFGALGCRVPRDAELVGNVRGRIYLNMTEFMTIASQVPGVRPSTLLSLGGGEAMTLELDIERQSPLRFLLRLPITVTRYLGENFRLFDRVAAFDRTFREERTRLTGVDYRILSSGGLDRVLVRVERLLDQTGQLMLSVYGSLLLAVLVLRAVLQVVAKEGEDVERLEREILTGLADVESAAPGLALWHVAEMARAEPKAIEALLAGGPDVPSLPEGPTRRALDRFFTAYGDRGAREAEIAEPRWNEDPSLPFATLRAHLRRAEGRASSPVDLERKQRAVREAAQAEIEARLPLPAQAAFRQLLKVVQRLMRLRERLRSNTILVLGLYRAVALDASRRVEAMEPGAGADAAFYLTVEELHAWLRGDVEAVWPIVRRRRLQFERDRALPEPPPTFVGFPDAPTSETTEDELLTGLAASGGIVRGRARVLRSSADAGKLEPGEVLVAPYADVGWSPLFLVASALVTDLGGPLSHASVVAREYGVPAVVNVPGGSRRIRTGDLVEVDGGAGTVRILERASV